MYDDAHAGHAVAQALTSGTFAGAAGSAALISDKGESLGNYVQVAVDDQEIGRTKPVAKSVRNWSWCTPTGRSATDHARSLIPVPLPCPCPPSCPLPSVLPPARRCSASGTKSLTCS